MRKGNQRLVVSISLVLFFCFCIAALIPNPAIAKKKEIIYVMAMPSYPEISEAIGLNAYVTSLIGLTQYNPDIKGKYTVKVYDKGMLYSNSDECLRAVSSGAAHITYTVPHHLESFDKSWKLCSAPGVFDDWYHFARTMKTKQWQELQQEMAKKNGVTILKWLFNTGDWYLFTSKGPIKKMEDLKGQKIRFPGGDAFGKALKSLGATTIALPYTEVVTALQTNMIDGLITDITGGDVYFDLPRHANYMVPVAVALQCIGLVCNTSWLESLEPKVRKSFLSMIDRIDTYNFYDDIQQKKIARWDASPKTILCNLSKSERLKWKETMKNAVASIINEADPKYMKAVESVR